MTTVHLPEKRSKYRNVKTVVDGITFASKKEANRYQDLKLLEKAGEIIDLDRQITFSLDPYSVHVCNYIADFVYETRDGKQVVEDVKGHRTKEYRIKKRLMLACHGIEIVEI